MQSADTKTVWGMFQDKAREFSVQNELKRPYILNVDMARASTHITSAIMFTDLRETFSLEERKALKVGALLGFLERYFSNMDHKSSIGLPANTVLEFPSVFYDKIEECCVQLPGKFDRNHDQTEDLETSIMKDIKSSIGKNYSEITKLDIALSGLAVYQYGTHLPKSLRQINSFHKLSQDAYYGFLDMAKQKGFQGKVVDGAAPYILTLMSDLRVQAQELVKSKNLDKTDLIWKQPTR